MEIFVYHWDYSNGSIYGDCIDNFGEYKLLKVQGHTPFCYVEGASAGYGTVSAVYKRMATSLDIRTLRPFYKVSFTSIYSMRNFVSYNRARCYMHEISQTTMFLSVYKLDNVGWFSVPQEIGAIHASTIRPVPDRSPPLPTIMVFDIEVRSADLGMPRAYRIYDEIKMISVVCRRPGCEPKRLILHTSGMLLGIKDATEVLCDNECELITLFFSIILSEDPDVITGYNIFGFDFDYIVSRLQLRLMDIPNVGRGGRPVSIVNVDWTSSAYGSNKYKRIVIGGRIILDMFLYFKRMKLDKYSLDFVSNKFLGEGKKKLSTGLNSAFVGDINALREAAYYCIRDSELVLMLFDKVDMWIDVCEVSKITRCGIEDIYTRGEQMKVVAQCVKECIDRDIVLKPQPIHGKWHEYEGAHVLDPVKGVYRGCALLDFQSLYPSIIIAFNICPSTYLGVGADGKHKFMTDTVGLFPGMVKRLLQERAAVKGLMSTCDNTSVIYTVLNRRQNALKVCANSVYGIMGFKNSVYFGHVGCAESVTSIGRDFLANVIAEVRTRYNLQVVYGDTDSCMIYVPGGQSKETTELARQICENITAQLPSPMALVFESYYESVILLSKKRYIMLDGQDRIHYKGVISARRDYCKYAKDMYTDIISMIARGDEGGIETLHNVVEYIDRRVDALLSGDVDVSELAITKSLVRDLQSYKGNQPHVVMAKRLAKKGVNVQAGTRLEYVFVKRAGNNCVLGERMATPEEVQDGGLEIDAKLYIERQLITQIDDVLEVMEINGYIKNRWLRG